MAYVEGRAPRAPGTFVSHFGSRLHACSVLYKHSIPVAEAVEAVGRFS